MESGASLELPLTEHGPSWPWPFLTSEVAPVAARFKARPEDFFVEEILSEEPSGTGDHIYVRIEKRGVPTPEAVRRLARLLGAHPRDAGVAGLKDAAAVARQTISFEHVDPERLSDLKGEELRILDVASHSRKLKRGKSRGNRFRVRLREIEPEKKPSVDRVLERLGSVGLPNAFGVQRFGARGDNAALGRSLLLGDEQDVLSRWVGRPMAIDNPRVREARKLFDSGDLEASAEAWPRSLSDASRLVRMLSSGKSPRKALAAMPRSALRFHVSALQSWVFNDVLAKRLQTLDRVFPGDLAWDHSSDRIFPCAASEEDQGRATEGEISATGPLPGRELRMPAEEALRLEEEALEPHEETLAILARPGRNSWPGSRRPLRVPLGDLEWSWGDDAFGDHLELRFSLPPGSYASIVALEIGKGELRTG